MFEKTVDSTSIHLAQVAQEPPSFGLITHAFDERYQSMCDIVMSQFDKEVQRMGQAQLLFFVLLVLECVLAGVFLSLWGATLSFALTLSSIFLTTFASFVTIIYLNTARTHRLIELRDRFLLSCRQYIGYQEGNKSHHLTLAEMASRLAVDMADREYSYLSRLCVVEVFRSYVESISAWKHWRDVHNFRRMLLESAIDESLSLVRCDPLNIEVHASLANAYVLMASLFCDPSRSETFNFDDEHQDRWLPPGRKQPIMEKAFRDFSSRAVEEFQIISDFAPEDPWVHAQLAYSYHDLKMFPEEIAAYEALLELCPEDHDARFRLGLLYFQQGSNAKGLEMYSRLKESCFSKADVLITFYGKQR